MLNGYFILVKQTSDIQASFLFNIQEDISSISYLKICYNKFSQSIFDENFQHCYEILFFYVYKKSTF